MGHVIAPCYKLSQFLVCNQLATWYLSSWQAVKALIGHSTYLSSLARAIAAQILKV